MTIASPRCDSAAAQQHVRSHGHLLDRVRSALFLLPAWLAPHSRMRVWFHRLRGVNIGRNVEIGYLCILDNVHPSLITIEDNAVVAGGAVLLAHDNSHYYAQGRPVRYGPVRIGRRAFIGINSVVLPGITVGERAIVGALSVVTADVPADSIVAGVPAREIRRS
jgi:acetyltransferase-like isoleucine patch superfamily enzyme